MAMFNSGQNVENVKVTRDKERWEIEIKAEIPVGALAHFRSYTLKDLGKHAQIKGFRTGHVPEDALIRHFGEEAILRETAEHAVKDVIPELLAKENANIVDAPQVSIEPPQIGKPIVFTARAPLAPEVKLPDYKGIATKMNGKREAVSVTDDEHRETLTHFRRERARIEKIESGTAPEKAAEETRALDEKTLPELDDTFVKTLGYDDSNVFSEKLREHLQNEKTIRAQGEHRAALLEALLKDATIHFPAILRDYELDEFEARFSGDLERMGKNFDGYLKEVKKTREEVRKEWFEAADKRAKIRILLSNIAREEKIEPDEAAVQHELEHTIKRYPNALRDTLRAHIVHALRNEKVLEWLEKLS